MADHPKAFTVKAWGANAIAFIEEQGQTREFSDWCGGWPCPVTAEMVASAPDLLEALEGIFAELDGRADAPGHCHTRPGIWDEDNAPELAGTSCDWCARWALARAAIAKARGQ